MIPNLGQLVELYRGNLTDMPVKLNSEGPPFSLAAAGVGRLSEKFKEVHVGLAPPPRPEAGFCFGWDVSHIPPC